MKTLLFMFLIGFSALSQGQSCDAAFKANISTLELYKLIAKRFHSKVDLYYQENLCSRNVYNLISDLRMSEIDTHLIDVYIIRPPMTKKWLHPNNHPSAKEWSHHVILSYKGKIYDFDFLELSNKHDLKTYIKKSLNLKFYNWRKLRIAKYNAQDYLKYFENYKDPQDFPLNYIDLSQIK